jgi:signal transduction histidine kinase
MAQTDFYEPYKASGKKCVEGNYAEALRINLNALADAEKTGNPVYLAYANTQVGNMYYWLKNKKSAVKSYMTAMAIIEKNSIDSMKAGIYHNTSVMYNELFVIDSALKYSGKAIAIFRKNKQYVKLSQALSALTDIYIIQLGDFRKSEELIDEAEKYARLSKNEVILAYAISKRSKLLAAQKKYKEAIEQLNMAGPIYRNYNLAADMMYYYRMQSSYRLKTGDSTALNYMDSLLYLRDSIFKKETAKQSAEYATLYQTEKKERENKLLQQENILKQTQIDSRNRMIIGMAIGILLITVLVAWRISVMNLRKKEKQLEATKALQKERERISRDLHDNVGGQLSYVLYSIDGLSDQNAEKRVAVTQSINESVRNVISNLRETIWAINDESVSVNDLSDKLKVYVRSMFRNTDVKIVFQETIEKNIPLNSLTGLNVYRICQEIINNAFKHAKASELTIAITASERLEIIITDNGIGFNKDTSTIESYGLTNMKKRADEAGIAFHWDSEEGRGTRFRLVV